ncbi:MAG: Rpn family recombination-promoting nuclease/putative transposase [Planctomycetaceae bacterium]
MSPGIDPRVDFAFKLVFGSPQHPRITIHFLNAVLNPKCPITWVEILNPIQGKDRSEDKLVILDILARDSQGRQFNIEMQTTLPLDLPKRLTLYNCINYHRQVREGQGYPSLRPAISICVLNGRLFKDIPDYHLSFRLRCDQHDLVFTDDLEFHTLELPKFERTEQEIRQCSGKEKWLYFLKHAEHMDAAELADCLPELEFEEAIGVLTMISQTPEDRQFYEARTKFLLDEEARLMQARLEGREEGRVEGVGEGREQGALIGKIQLLQVLLGHDESPTADLANRSVLELEAQREQLQSQLRGRDA